MVATTINSCACQTMSSSLLHKLCLMSICFRSVLDTTQSDKGQSLCLKRIKRKRNLRTRSPLISYLLMMTRNHVVLPYLLKRTRAKVETSHLMHHRHHLSLYVSRREHSLRRRAYNSPCLCNARSRRQLHRPDIVNLHHDGLIERGKYQLARVMSMGSHGTRQTFSRMLKGKHRGETWLTSQARVALALLLELFLGTSHRFPDLALPNNYHDRYRNRETLLVRPRNGTRHGNLLL